MRRAKEERKKVEKVRERRRQEECQKRLEEVGNEKGPGRKRESKELCSK